MQIQYAVEILDVLAFAMLVSAQFMAVVAVRSVDREPGSGSRRRFQSFHFGKLAWHRERALILRRIYVCSLMKQLRGALRSR